MLLFSPADMRENYATTRKNCMQSLFPLIQLWVRGDAVCVHVCLSESKTEIHETQDGWPDFTLSCKGFICWLIYNAHYVVHLLFFPLFLLKKKKKRGFCCKPWSPYNHMPQSSMKYSDTSTQMELISFPSLCSFHTVVTEFSFLQAL